MTGNTRDVVWIGGAQDGATVKIPKGATWVTVLEDRARPKGEPTTERSLVRYTVPVIEDRIIWAQRKEADPEEQQ